MSSKGFTLIETLVSLVIFLLIALGVTFGLQRAVSGNVFDSQRQDVVNTTLSILNTSTPPTQLCPPVGGTTVKSAVTPAGLAFTINITCVVDNVPVPPASTTTVPVTQLTAVAQWTTYGSTRNVTIQE